MKIALAFLLLGLSSCLVSTNSSVGKRKITEGEGLFHARFLFAIFTRVDKWKTCNKCSDIERYCLEKAIVEDICLLLRLLSEDMQCTRQDLILKMNVGIRSEFIINAVQNNHIDILVKELRRVSRFETFVQSVSGLLNTHLKEANIELGEIFATLNSILGGVLNSALGLVTGVFDVGLNLVNGLLGGAIGGATGAVTGAVGGAIHGVTGAVGGVTDTVGKVVGGITNTVGGLAGAATGVVGSVGKTVGSLAGSVTGLLGKKGILG